MDIITHSHASVTTFMDDLRISTAVLGTLVYIAGFIGNFLSFLLFAQKELRQVSTGLIFLLLNVFSTIHLLSLIVEFLDSIFQVQLVASGVFRCQFILWLQNVTRTICSFLATSVSIDRYLRSEYPMQSRIWCTGKNTVKLCIGYVVFSMILYAFFFYQLNLFDSDGQCSFSYNETFRLFALNVLPPIRFILVCIMPSVVMLGCGTRMILNIRRSRKRVAAQMTLPNQGIAMAVISVSTGTHATDDYRRQQIKIDQMLLLMLLANVTAYILTQIPFNIYTLYYGYRSSDDYTSYSVTRAFLLMWGSVYFGIGFYLFSITSAHFRRHFRKQIRTLFSCCRR